MESSVCRIADMLDSVCESITIFEYRIAVFHNQYGSGEVIGRDKGFKVALNGA